MDLKIAASRAGISGIEIARQMGVTPATASRWLSRKQAIPDIQKRALAALIGVALDDLLPEKDSEHGQTARREERTGQESQGER
jgi:transcriptional regulator with XRE-family HTH domain